MDNLNNLDNLDNLDNLNNLNYLNNLDNLNNFDNLDNLDKLTWIPLKYIKVANSCKIHLFYVILRNSIELRKIELRIRNFTCN